MFEATIYIGELVFDFYVLLVEPVLLLSIRINNTFNVNISLRMFAD
jgi:hypothetical protein